MAATPETPASNTEAPTAETVPAAVGVRTLSRPALIAIIGLGAAVLVAIIVIIMLVVPKTAVESADAPIAPVPSTSPTPRPSATPTRTATPTPTKTADAVAAPPAPDAPAPAPVEPAPAPAQPLPAPPAPVIPTPTITSMDAYYSGPCTTSTQVFLAWTSTNGNSANINVRSGGGTPVFNQNWQGYPANGNNGFWIDCTRPVWFFTLTIVNSAGSKDGRLTFANGSSQGWSSN